VREVILAAFFVFLGAHSVLWAQTDEVKRLENLISQAQSELDAEEAALKADKEKFSASEKEMQEKTSALRQEIASLKTEVEETAKKNQGFSEEIVSLKDQTATNSDVLTRLNQFAQEASEELAKKSEVLPANRFGNLFTAASSGAGKGGFPRIGEIFRTALEYINLTETVTLQSDRVVTADGTEQPARFLTVGGVAQVYLTEDGKESGALLYSEGGGRKFQHELPRQIRRAIKELFESANTGKEQILLVPVDVTQEMIAGTEYGFKGITNWFVRGGPVMIPIALVALLALVMVVNRLIVLHRESADAQQIFERALSVQKNSNWEEASGKLRSAHGALAAVLSAGIENRAGGIEKIEEAMRSASLAQIGRLERFLPSIAVLATVSPLLGLLGTVTGMIATFNTIAAFGSSDPRLLSGGISEALITPEAGLIIAIPVMLIHSLLCSRVDRIIEEMEKAIVKTVNIFSEEPPRNSNEKR
jgi:biopolymer transport protein ExbB